MTDASDHLPLASEFPAATREQWRKLVDGVLKGAPFDKRLVARTYDGLAIQPLYDRKADAQPVAGRAPGTPWSIVQRVDHPEPAAANAEALCDLENGATGLSLVFAGAVGAYGYGLPATDDAHHASVGRRAPRCRHRDRHGSRSDSDDIATWLAALLKAGNCARRHRHTLRFRPDRRRCSGGRRPAVLERARAGLQCRHFRFGRQRLCGPFACGDGRVITMPAARGAGTRLRAGSCRRLSARSRPADALDAARL